MGEIKESTTQSTGLLFKTFFITVDNIQFQE
jgi:hypothetical protein